MENVSGVAWPRRVGWWALLGAVLLGHGAMTLWLRENIVGWGEGALAMPPRIEVAYVNALAPAAPLPPPAPGATAKLKASKARTPAPPASAPDVAPPEPMDKAPATETLLLSEAMALPSPVPDIAPATAMAASEAPVAAPEVAREVGPSASETRSGRVAFEWPPSTRLTYALTGNYRGEVHGSARVQWVREGSRYQVHLDIAIGPSFAPLISRRMTSDGDVGAQGLTPLRYDEATRMPFQPPRRVSLLFTPELVTLANGSQQQAVPGIQDAASQFVQLTWLFTTQPELLRAGNTVVMPLALPRRIGRWVYDVLGQERLNTPIGELDTFHLKPRLGERKPGNELTAEVWFAPNLQYLPVRIRIQQDADTFVDLLIDSAPMQAAPAPAAAAR